MSVLVQELMDRSLLKREAGLLPTEPAQELIPEKLIADTCSAALSVFSEKVENGTRLSESESYTHLYCPGQNLEETAKADDVAMRLLGEDPDHFEAPSIAAFEASRQLDPSAAEKQRRNWAFFIQDRESLDGYPHITLAGLQVHTELEESEICALFELLPADAEFQIGGRGLVMHDTCLNAYKYNKVATDGFLSVLDFLLPKYLGIVKKKDHYVIEKVFVEEMGFQKKENIDRLARVLNACQHLEITTTAEQIFNEIKRLKLEGEISESDFKILEKAYTAPQRAKGIALLSLPNPQAAPSAGRLRLGSASRSQSRPAPKPLPPAYDLGLALTLVMSTHEGLGTDGKKLIASPGFLMGNPKPLDELFNGTLEAGYIETALSVLSILKTRKIEKANFSEYETRIDQARGKNRWDDEGAWIRFFLGEGTDDIGRGLQELRDRPPEYKRQSHNYIQEMFPTSTPSTQCVRAPVLKPEMTRAFLEEDPRGKKLRAALRDNFLTMLEFYGFQEEADGSVVTQPGEFIKIAAEWLKPNSHDLWRISRILESLVTLGLRKEAINFYYALYNLRFHPVTSVPCEHYTIPQTTLDNWSEKIKPLSSSSGERPSEIVNGFGLRRLFWPKSANNFSGARLPRS
jgi:hypothetical protein